MVLSLLINGALDIGFGLGWWIVKKVGGSMYDLGSNLFYERSVKPTLSHIVDLPKEEDHIQLIKLMELVEHDLVEIKHNQSVILHRLEIDEHKID
jgi:hypothetical protein